MYLKREETVYQRLLNWNRTVAYVRDEKMVGWEDSVYSNYEALQKEAHYSKLSCGFPTHRQCPLCCKIFIFSKACDDWTAIRLSCLCRFHSLCLFFSCRLSLEMFWRRLYFSWRCFRKGRRRYHRLLNWRRIFAYTRNEEMVGWEDSVYFNYQALLKEEVHYSELRLSHA